MNAKDKQMTEEQMQDRIYELEEELKEAKDALAEHRELVAEQDEQKELLLSALDDIDTIVRKYL